MGLFSRRKAARCGDEGKACEGGVGDGASVGGASEVEPAAGAAVVAHFLTGARICAGELSYGACAGGVA